MKPKFTFLIITLLTLSLLIGCSNSNKQPSDKAPKSSHQAQKIQLKPYAPPKDWKLLDQQEVPMSTADWIDFQMTKKEPVGYSLSYPGDWTLEYSVFMDKDGQKVAELIPPIALSQGQKPFDKWQPADGEKLISRTEITVGDFAGQKIITETRPDDGPVWYPHSYCLAKGDKAFMIIFYERELGSGNEAIFDKIASTLKFH